MWKTAQFICSLLIFTSAPILANTDAPLPSSGNSSTIQFLRPFTAKILRDKVRLRTQPNIEAPIVKELEKGDLFIVVGETEDFYAVQPQKNTKAYIFRTFVLDNQVEGSRVNVRLKPDLDSPVVAQLNSGDRVEGAISAQNNKWLEIAPPLSTRFFVSKDFLEKIGDASLLARLEQRQDEVKQLLTTTLQLAESEFQKPFENIQLETITNNLRTILQSYADFPKEVAQAGTLLKQIEDKYLKEKLAYLESKAQNFQSWQSSNHALITQIATQQDKLAELETQLSKKQQLEIAETKKTTQISFDDPDVPPARPTVQQPISQGATSRMTAWEPTEQGLYAQWTKQNGQHSLDSFYEVQREHAITLRGLIEPYQKPVKNKPGDYVLLNSFSNLPVAYLYSTQVNLQDYVGREITIQVSPRPNNNYAYPAYYVLAIE